MENDNKSVSDYVLRHSYKAKYLQLRVSRRGVEVIVPARKRISNAEIEQFVVQKQQWLAKTKRKFQLIASPNNERELPDVIQLTALNQSWNIKYCKTLSPCIKIIRNPNHELILLGNIDAHLECYQALHLWLKQIAKPYFKAKLDSLSELTGLSYNQLTVRLNSTRWGSCSAKKHISLCCKLLFLSEALVEHVIFHELCHTKIMNHGVTFWRLLAKFDKQASSNAKLLKISGANVPGWLV